MYDTMAVLGPITRDKGIRYEQVLEKRTRPNVEEFDKAWRTVHRDARWHSL